ncbi:MAG TPA: hypothetical protein VFE58_00155 [Tepidisphaeraceae bacterium]|jgi:hypothetical protein|nr:hypothetical protein [Tepidisphaeraceae bacterium]
MIRLANAPVPVLRSTPSDGDIDWTSWIRRADRKRRLVIRPRAVLFPTDYFCEATYSSFALADMNIVPAQVAEAVDACSTRRTFRSRQNQRIRNHIAILHQIESILEFRRHLSVDTILRWYTSISCGLSTYPLDSSVISRLNNITCEISTPQPRLRRAITQVATLHLTLLADPIFPAFNSILARLLLRYHLGRHSLPPVTFDPATDRPALNASLPRFLPLFLDRLESSLDAVKN